MSTAEDKTNIPQVHQEYESLGTKDKKIRCRILQFQHPEIGISPPLLDLRRFYVNKDNGDGTKYTGWSKQAVSLGIVDLKQLRDIIEKAIPQMEEIYKTYKKE